MFKYTYHHQVLELSCTMCGHWPSSRQCRLYAAMALGLQLPTAVVPHMEGAVRISQILLPTRSC